MTLIVKLSLDLASQVLPNKLGVEWIALAEFNFKRMLFYVLMNDVAYG